MHQRKTPQHPDAPKAFADKGVHDYLEKHFLYIGQQFEKDNIRRIEVLSSQEPKTRLIAYNVVKYFKYDTADSDFVNKVHEEVKNVFAEFISRQKSGLEVTV